MKLEVHTCGRRFDGYSQLRRNADIKKPMDCWRPGDHRWGSPFSRWWEQVSNRINNWWMESFIRVRILKRKGSCIRHGGTTWPEAFPAPRSCSFCGGVHPGDAVDLLSLGWTVDHTGKGYKAYLNPPRGHRHPVPPVKFYTQHLEPDSEKSDAIIKIVNAAPRTSFTN